MTHRTLALILGLTLVNGSLTSCGPGTKKPKGADDQLAAQEKEFKHCPIEQWGWGADYNQKIVAIVENPECNPSDRKDAIARAGDMRIFDAVPHLFDILEKGTDSTLRVEAIRALGNFGTRRVLRPYEAMLDDPDPQVSTAAAKALATLAYMGDRYAVHLMKRLARDEDRDDLRTIAVVALGRAGKFSVADDVIALLGSDQATIRGDAAEALGIIGDVKAVEPLLGLLEDEDKTVRSKVCAALGSIGDPKAAKPLLKVAKDDVEKYVRGDAAYALGRIADQDSLPKLIEVLKEADQNERWGYQYAIGSYGTLAFDAAVELMASERKGLRQAGVSILSQTHDTRAKEHLVKGLDDKSQEVRMDTARALGQLAGKDVVKALLDRYKKEKTEDVRSEILSAMGYIGDAKFLPVLIQASKEEANRLKAQAVRGLGSYKEQKAIDALIVALESDNEWVRESAASTLAQLKTTQAIEPIKKLLEDDDAYVRMTAIESLGQIGDSSLVPELAKHADDKDENVRRSVLSAMGNLGGEKALEILIAALDDEKEYVRETALRGLGQILGEREVDDIGPFMVAYTKGLQDKDYYVKREAAYRIAEMRLPFPEGVQEGLIRALDSADDYVLEEIVWALSRVDDPDVAERLLMIVKESKIGVDTSLEQAVASMDAGLVEGKLVEFSGSDDILSSASAQLALAYLGAKDAQDIIIPKLESDNDFTRQIAASALSITGDAKAIGPLEKRLEDPDEDVVMEALSSLGMIGRRHEGVVNVDLVMAKLDSRNLRVSSTAAHALGLMGDKKAAKRLLELFHDNATKIKSMGCGFRCSIVADYGGALMSLGADTETVKALVEMLGEPHPRTRSEAARVLSYVATKDAAPGLIAAVKSETDIYTRDSLIAALGQTGSPKAVAVLKGLLSEADTYTTSGVLHALGRTGSAKEAKLIMGYLDHPRSSIQVAAIDALGRLKHKKAVPALVELVGKMEHKWIQHAVYESLVRIGDAKGCEETFTRVVRDGERKDDVILAGLASAALRIEPVRPVFEKRIKRFGLGGRLIDVVAYLYGDDAKGNELFEWLLTLRIPRRNTMMAGFILTSFAFGSDPGRKYLETLSKEADSLFVSSMAESILKSW
jgi:HEAT repeat protein